MGDDLYRGYKGGLYRLLLEATDEATGQPVIVYQNEQDGRVWVRTAASTPRRLTERLRAFSAFSDVRRHDCRAPL